MQEDNTKNRRSFLKTAGLALVAASMPAAIHAQRRPSGQNNLKQILLGCHVMESNPQLPGVFGLACPSFQMTADINGTSGAATLTDPIFSEVNSHIEINSGRADFNDIYVFRGTVERSQNSELMGRNVLIKVAMLPDGNCNFSLTIEETELKWLLLPAIQKVRDKA